MSHKWICQINRGRISRSMMVAHAHTQRHTRTRVLPFELSSASRIVQILTITLLIFAVLKKKAREQTVRRLRLTPVDVQQRRRHTGFLFIEGGIKGVNINPAGCLICLRLFQTETESRRPSSANQQTLRTTLTSPAWPSRCRPSGGCTGTTSAPASRVDRCW